MNEAPRGRDREVSTAGYGNNAAELRGIKPIPNKIAKNSIPEEQGYNVIKRNDLIQYSRYNLTIQEQKIILYLISKIAPSDTDLKLYSFNIGFL
jgi:hypothetical protein